MLVPFKNQIIPFFKQPANYGLNFIFNSKKENFMYNIDLLCFSQPIQVILVHRINFEKI